MYFRDPVMPNGRSPDEMTAGHSSPEWGRGQTRSTNSRRRRLPREGQLSAPPRRPLNRMRRARSQMSFKSRQKRRMKKAAIRKARRHHASETPYRYFLTIVTTDARCTACGGHLRRNMEFVYRKHGPVCLCVSCADRDPLVTYRPSSRWENRRRQQRGRP